MSRTHTPHRTFMAQSRRLFAGMTVAAAILLSACESYRPMPASQEAINEAIAPVPRDTLALEAARLKHPALPAVLIQEDGSLSPRAAAVVAVLQSPSLRALRARRGVAEAQLTAAGILPNPQLSASVDFPIAGSTDGTVNAFGLGGTWDITSLVTRDAARGAAREAKVAIDLDTAWQEWQTAMAAALHATRVLWISRQVTELEQQAAEADASAQQAAQNVREGYVTAIEGDAAAALAQKRRTALLAAQATLRTESMLLRQAMGLPGDTRVRVVEDEIELQADAPFGHPSREEIARTVEESRLDLSALRAGYLSEEEKVRSAVLSQFPKIGLGITRARDTSNVGTRGFGITLDLPIFDRGQGRIGVETATRQQLFDELAARTFDARADAARAYDDLDAVGPQVVEADRTVERLTRLAASLQQARLQGDVDIVVLSQARNDLGDAKVDAVRVRQLQAELRIAVEVATGRLMGKMRGTDE